MATNAAIGYGAAFAIYDGVSSYVAVAEVVNITPPGRTRDAVDATHMASPNKYREYIAGLLDAGEATIEINFVPAVSDVINTAMEAGVGTFQITHPNGIRLQFSAVVTNYEPDMPIDGKMVANVTFKVSGKPTLLASL